MGTIVSNSLNTSSSSNYSNTDWMSKIDDNTSIANLSIPGTHNSMSFYGGPLVQCQSWPLDQQLKSGIRFFDIRCRHFNDNMCIHHGAFYQKVNLSTVLNGFKTFLTQNPGETILMRVKPEHTEEGNTETYEDTLKSYFADYRRFIWTGTSIPALKKVRGKVVILRNFEGTIGIDYNSLKISDHFRVPTILRHDIEEKWNAVKGNLDDAKKGSKSDLYLTFASGVSSGAYPKAVADRVNSKVYEYIPFGRRDRLGIIAFDYPGSATIKNIISSNVA